MFLEVALDSMSYIVIAVKPTRYLYTKRHALNQQYDEAKGTLNEHLLHDPKAPLTYKSRYSREVDFHEASIV